MFRSLLTAFLGLALFGSSGCGSPQPGPTADSPMSCTGKCDNAQQGSVFIQANQPFYWQASTYEDFVTADSLSFGLPVQPVLDDVDLLTQRTQAWLDKLDAVVRADVQAKTGHALVAPRPLAKIIPSKQQFNAWVSPVPTCLHKPLRDGGTSGSFSYLGASAVSPIGDVGAAACVASTAGDDAAFASFWNEGRLPCRLSIDAASVDVTGASCDTAPGTASEHIGYAATSPYVHVTSDLIANSTEEAFVTTLAHELGHYYRGHVTEKASARYDYWYRRDPKQKKQPLPAADADRLSAAYNEIVAPNLTPQRFASRYSSRLRPFLLTGLAPLLRERTEASFGCRTAAALLGAWTDDVLLSELPLDESQASLRSFEDALAACASRLTLDAEGSARSLRASSVLFAAAQDRPGPTTVVTLKPHETLASFLTRLEQSARGLDQKAELLRARVNQNRVGLYTTEQEADDLSLLLSTRLGITPDEVIAGWLDTMQVIDDQIAASGDSQISDEYYVVRGEMTAAACRALYEQGFEQPGTDGRKEATFVPLGNLSEPHHATCYRVFNLYQQAQAYSYPVGDRATVSGPSWETVRQHARTISDNATD